MKTAISTLRIIILMMIICNQSFSQDYEINVTHDVCYANQGAFQFVLNENTFSFPLQLEYENVTSGEFFEIEVLDNNFSLANLPFGEYVFNFIMDEDHIYEMCDEIFNSMPFSEDDFDLSLTSDICDTYGILYIEILNDVTLNAALPYTMYISGGNTEYSNSLFLENDLTTIGDIPSGNYHIYILTDSDCEVSFDVSIDLDPIEIQFETTPSCDNDGTIAASVFGGAAPYTFIWTDDVDETSNNRSGLNSKLYTLEVTDVNGCFNVASTYVKDADPITLGEPVIKSSSCSENTGRLHFLWKAIGGNGGPYTYTWNNGVDNLNNYDLYAGNYILTVTDAEGCTISFEYTVPSEGQPTTFSTVQNTCENAAYGEIAYSFVPEVGPIEYSWDSSIDDNIEVLNGNIVEITNLYPGIYCVTATDTGNGCFTNACMTVDIIESDELVFQSATVKPSCNFEANGSIYPGVTGGYGDKTYSWSNGYNQISPKNLLPGTYQVTVSDYCGNTTSAEYEIIGVNFDLEVSAEVKCVNFDTKIGSIDLTLEGSSPPYSFFWSNGATTEDIEVSQYGEYSVYITDANGCQIFESYQVNETFGTMIANVEISDLSNCEDTMKIRASAIVYGGDAPYIFKWNDGSEESTMKVSMSYSDWEIPLIYAVTITDQCGNEEIISDNFICNDICDEHCIFAYKTGHECTDYCDDHPLYTNDIGCDKIKIECHCDDGVSRTVLWKNGWEEATFIGEEAQEGSYLEEDVILNSPLTYTFFIRNENTGCTSKIVLSREDDRCGTGIFPWIFNTFGLGSDTPSADSGTPCTDDEDWFLVSFDDNECEEIFECDEDPEATRIIKSTKLCKIQDSNTMLWGVYEYCDPTCTLFSTISSSAEEPNGMKKCPDCLPAFVDPCDDPVDLYTNPDLNGFISFVKNKNKDHFITKILDESGKEIRYFISENFNNYLIKFIRITKNGLLTILLNEVTLEYSLVKILPYQEYEIIKTFYGETVENLFDSGIGVDSFEIVTRSKVSGLYKKYIYNLNNRTISGLPGHIGSLGQKIIWKTFNNYFDITIKSGFNTILQNGGGFTQTNTIDSKVIIKTIDQYSEGFIVTGVYSGNLNVDGQVYSSNNQYSTVIYWCNRDGALLRYKILENKIITRASIKQNVMVYAGYELDSFLITDEILEETTRLQDFEGICSFLDILDLDNPIFFQNTMPFDLRNVSKLSVSIFPNPTKEKITISINSDELNEENGYRGEVFNIYGAKVNSFEMVKEYVLDLSKYDSGIYLIHIKDQNRDMIFSEKIVKL